MQTLGHFFEPLYVDDTIGHLSSFEYMSDFAWNLFYAGQCPLLPYVQGPRVILEDETDESLSS